jgi:NADPH:quinone reductase
MMCAAAIDQFGAPDWLNIRSLPVPKAGPHQLLIELRAAGIGIWDAEMRRGEYSNGSEKFPLVLGTDGKPTTRTSSVRNKRSSRSSCAPF